MFCVIYEFEVIEGCDIEFKNSWHQLTLIIKETRGGLGSRLHKDMTRENIWIAYAQWPSKEAWDKPSAFTDQTQIELRERMGATCKSIRTIHQLEVVDDLLVISNEK